MMLSVGLVVGLAVVPAVEGAASCDCVVCGDSIFRQGRNAVLSQLRVEEVVTDENEPLLLSTGDGYVRICFTATVPSSEPALFSDPLVISCPEDRVLVVDIDSLSSSVVLSEGVASLSTQPIHATRTEPKVPLPREDQLESGRGDVIEGATPSLESR